MSIIHVNADTFESTVLSADKPVLADFWATWCGPCQMLAPVIEEIEQEHPEIAVAKIDVDDNPQLAMLYGINSIPAVLLFKDGKVVGQAIGFRPKEALLTALGL